EYFVGHPHPPPPPPPPPPSHYGDRDRLSEDEYWRYKERKQRRNPTHAERVFEAVKKKELEIRKKEKENSWSPSRRVARDALARSRWPRRTGGMFLMFSTML
ncbi:hypothetical protein AAVH_36213, partial [Aphelenchoides avenae]